MISRVLRRGMRGDDVAQWQIFLTGQGFDAGTVDGLFGGRTHTATCGFQEARSLEADGVVGRQTIACAFGLGLGELPDPENHTETNPDWPPPPAFSSPDTAQREAMFGRFAYVPDPQPTNREAIRITDSWAKDNIVTIQVPQLRGKTGANANGDVTCHRRAEAQIKGLFAAWERARLLDRVISWGGCFAPRFIRGNPSVLSTHAFGAAFDINAAWNGCGVEPARVGKKGSVRELVEIANDFGFYWGGHYKGRPDGMHFEIAQRKEVDVGAIGPRPGGLPLTLAEGVTAPPIACDLTGGAFYEQIQALTGKQRENAIADALVGGGIPPFLRTFCDVEISAVDKHGKLHTGVVHVLPDYLAVGSDTDFFRVPMNPMTAQRVADAYGCLLPTKKLADVIHAQAVLKLEPQPLPPGPQMTTSPYYKRHNDRVEAQRAGRATGYLTGGHKKDVVISNRLGWKPKSVAIYGWHRTGGGAIQPLSTVHEDTYADYSHGIRLVHGTMIADGEPCDVADVLKDPVLSVLLSDEGPIHVLAYVIRDV